MVLETLSIQHIRNHKTNEFRFPENGILLWGENGAGKTAVLESISMLCTSKSFVTSADKSIVNRDAEKSIVSGSLLNEGGSKHTVELRIPQGPGRKMITLDNSNLPSSVELIGRFPVVSLSPQYRAITTGSPSERRSFIDFVISQAHHSYLMDLVEYRKVVKQRNALLGDQERRPAEIKSMIAPWNEHFAQLAARIVSQRMKFIEMFQPIFQDAYLSIVPDNETPSLRYAATIDQDFTAQDISDRILEDMESNFNYELRRKSTTIGPHRDDMEILLNGMDVRDRASQGQHKSLLIALKLGEYYFLTERLDEKPVLLLDDVFSELDNSRLARIMDLIGTLGQTFITSASDAVAQHFPVRWKDTLMLHIRAGQVIEEGVPS